MHHVSLHRTEMKIVSTVIVGWAILLMSLHYGMVNFKLFQFIKCLVLVLLSTLIQHNLSTCGLIQYFLPKHVMLLILQCLSKGTHLLTYLFFYLMYMCINIYISKIRLEKILIDRTCEICSSNLKFYEKRKTKITKQNQNCFKFN